MVIWAISDRPYDAIQQIFSHRPIKNTRFLGQVANMIVSIKKIAFFSILFVNKDFPSLRKQMSCDELDQGWLTSARRSDKCYYISSWDDERKVSNNRFLRIITKTNIFKWYRALCQDDIFSCIKITVGSNVIQSVDQFAYIHPLFDPTTRTIAHLADLRYCHRPHTHDQDHICKAHRSSYNLRPSPQHRPDKPEHQEKLCPIIRNPLSAFFVCFMKSQSIHNVFNFI